MIATDSPNRLFPQPILISFSSHLSLPTYLFFPFLSSWTHLAFAVAPDIRPEALPELNVVLSVISPDVFQFEEVKEKLSYTEVYFM